MFRIGKLECKPRIGDKKEKPSWTNLELDDNWRLLTKWLIYNWGMRVLHSVLEKLNGGAIMWLLAK